ncbi:hypothetical protein C0992_001564 [Termitomyces sp. T32_za158]|nr:hypothetical protein C0992_001564 [Termitomyces sp. T32_za158]
MFRFLIGVFTSLLATGIFALPQATSTSFVLIGDSTTANGTTVNSGGWGNGLCGSTLTGNIASVAAGTPCINTAKNGATTGTFVEGGYFSKSLAAIRGEVANGRRTLVTIQFGHNDQKIAPPESMAANMTSMVQQIRAAGGEPVLVTSLCRRNFSANGTVSDTLGPWAADLLAASYPGELPIVANAALSYNISHGIASY